jgi:integrase
MRSEIEGFWICNLLDRFEAAKKKTIAPSYYSNYKRMVQVAKDYFGTSDVRELRKLDLVKYKERIETDLKGKTVKNYLDLLRVFLNWCQNDLEIIEKVPSFPEVNIEEPNFRWLSQDDQIKLFGHVPEVDKPIMACMILCGVRPGEARALRCKDVDLRNNTITVTSTWSKDQLRERRKGRGAKKLVIPIHPEVFDYVSERVERNLPSAFLFANPITQGPYSVQRLRKVWAKVKAAAKITGLRLYDATRHSFASQLVNAGVPINAVSDLMGHSTLRITQRYAHGDLSLKATTLQKMSLKKVLNLDRTSPGLAPEKGESKIN